MRPARRRRRCRVQGGRGAGRLKGFGGFRAQAGSVGNFIGHGCGSPFGFVDQPFSGSPSRRGWGLVLRRGVRGGGVGRGGLPVGVAREIDRGSVAAHGLAVDEAVDLINVRTVTGTTRQPAQGK